jgi:hypothetical protein
LKGTSVLTLQNHVSLSNLMTIRSFNAGFLKARAWETLRAAVQGVALTRAVAPIRSVAPMPGGHSATPKPAAWGNQDLPRMRRGVERC